MAGLRTLKDVDVAGKVVLCRVDLNVPMKNGRVEDATRVRRVIPTIEYLIRHKAKVVIISHFGRPKGGYAREMSLVTLADTISTALDGKFVKFALDCIGSQAKSAVENMADGDVLLMENLRFHEGEEKNDPEFVAALASLGDIFVNDTFSCSHRAHASIVGLAEAMPSYAGLLLQEEIENLERVLSAPQTPMAAIVGGSKISTKLELLQALIYKVDALAIGGAMANTFLKAQGKPIGKSLYERELVDEAKQILDVASKNHCDILLPLDVVVAKELKDSPVCQIVSANDVPNDAMILDLGPRTVIAWADRMATCKTVVWNGPLGAFEYRPFDVASITLAQHISALTASGTVISVAGGGDVVAALGISGLTASFSYISTAGGAFLEWLQGKGLPGVEALYDNPNNPQNIYAQQL